MLKDGSSALVIRPKKVLEEAGKEIGIYAGMWAQNDPRLSFVARREMRHGTGTFIAFPSGAFYEGQWMYDRMHGMGRLIESSGSCYEGSWINNQRTG